MTTAANDDEERRGRQSDAQAQTPALGSGSRIMIAPKA